MAANYRTLILTASTAVLIGASVGYAQSSTSLEQAELASLSPDLRTQVQREPPAATR